MAQRLNKKLLLGLGSTLGFLGTGVVSGFGLNAIVNNASDFKQDQLAVNALPEANFKQVPNYNVATRDMFIDTRDLRRFHFGNTQIGQTVTTNGWLGVFDDKRNANRNAHRIALTGWNGEIIWVNDDYVNETNSSNFNVYDMKYDYNTNLIFVLRTSDPRGISPNGSTPLTMDVLDARNGQRVNQIDSNAFQSIQRNAYNSITNSAYFNSIVNDPIRSKNLFQLDISSKPNSNEVLVTWMPNYMQLANNRGNLADFLGFKQTFNTAMKGFLFTVSNNNGFNVSHRTINFPNMQTFLTISSINWQDPLWDFKTYNMRNYSLLANPFFTTDSGRGFILHLIVGSNGTDRYNDGIRPPSEKDRSGEQVLHAGFGFNPNWTENRNNIFVQQIGGDQSAFPPSAYHQDLNAYKAWPFKVNLHTNSWFKNPTNSNMVQANLRINKNMFDNNSLVFAYPYATGSGYPIYNVMQLNINQNNGRISYDYSTNNKKRSTNWEFGKDINDYFTNNNRNYGASNNTAGNVNRIFPFPGSTNNARDINHNYNRLISVSPFDNTFIYGAKSNLKYAALQPDNNANNNKYASFWVSSDNLRNNKPLIRPIVIANDTSINNQTIDGYMTDVNSLYLDGFTFDPRSSVTRANNIKSLNLYFNQNGTGQNDAYADNGLVSSKIGLLKDILSESNSAVNSGSVVWINNVSSPYLRTEPDNTTFRLLTAGIDRDSYSTIIHSRANLAQWYTHSWTNSNRPGNMFNRDQRLNETDASADRAIAKIFDNPLDSNDSDVNSNKAVDLLSAWKDKNGNTKYAKNPPNYNRLAIKRPTIKIGSNSLGRNALSLVTTYELTPDAQREVFNKPGWQPPTNRTNFVLTKTETVNNVSYQVVSSWQADYKMNRIYSDTGQSFNANNVQWRELRQPTWLDKIKQPNLAFGSGNNNVAKNRIQPLRLMLKLIRPTGNLPSWFDARFGINSDFFNRAYPIEAAYPNETTFGQMINEFANLKAEHIDLSDGKNANAAVGLGNMKIEAYLELNPKFVNVTNETTSKIYKLDDGKTKFLYDSTSGERIMYKDDFRQERLIYDQSQIDYDRFQDGAFGQANSNLRNQIQRSWAPNTLTRNFNIKVVTDYDRLPDTLVRTATGNNDPVFRFIYINNNTQLELSPTNTEWFKNRMENFNRLLNLFVQFEYQTANQQNSNTWLPLGTFLTDSQIKAKMKNGKLILDARNNSNQLISNIKKLRFKLTTKGNSNSDPNLSIWQNNFQRDEVKYISAPNPLAIENFVVQPSYISNVILTNPNQSINSLNQNDIDNFINQVKSQSSTNDPALLAQVSLIFSYNGQDNLNAQTLFEAIKKQREGVEPFSLWNGTNGTNRIRAKFVLLSNQGIQFVRPDGQAANETDLSADVKANLKTEVDLTTYINQLQNQALRLSVQPTVPGQMNGQNIIFPSNNTVNGYFATMSFNDIKRKLETQLGIKIRFQAWNPQNSSWGTATYNPADLTTYNVSNPAIRLSFEFLSNWNSKLLFNGTELNNNNAWFTLKLSLPKVIKKPPANAIQQMINSFNNQNIFSGNTFNLNVDNTKFNLGKNPVIDALIAASTTNAADYSELKTNNQLVVLEFKLGTLNWMDATTLQTELAKQTADQNDNSLKMRIKLSSEDNFILATDLQGAEFQLLNNNNDVIKKWIHGTDYERVLKTGNAVRLSPNSSKNNLQYVYDPILQPLFNNPGRDGLIIQWSLGSNPNDWKNLKNGQNSLPRQVDVNETSIKIRVAKDPTSQVYLYGPETQSNRSVFTLDLSQIPTPVQINKDWFNEITLSVSANQFLQDLDGQHFTSYENEFFAKSDSLTNNALLRAKVKLKYRFHNSGSWINGTEMAQTIKQKLNNFTSTDQGVWALSHDGQTYKGNNGFNKNVYVINARVTTVKANDSTIQFVSSTNPDQNINDDQLAGNIKSNIKTKIDLGPWINEIITTGITAARADRPGQLNPNTIQIPGKASVNPQVQFGGKSFNEIQTILNNVNVFVQYKKFDVASNTWSGWLDRTNQINTYNPQMPEIILGFKLTNSQGNTNDRQSINVQVFNNGTEIQAATEQRIKLNVPKLVKEPANLIETIKLFNAQNPFGGNTFKLDVNNSKLNAAEQEFVNAIRTASQTTGRFDNLDTALFFTYKLGDSPDWKTANDLKNYLAGKNNVDQSSNELKIKVNLETPRPGTSSEFELDPTGSWEYVLWPDNNQTIKKWLHGNVYENALKQNNAITPRGNKNALTYTFVNDLNSFSDVTTFPNGLTLEYQLNGTGAWTKNTLPTTVAANINTIKVRISQRDKENVYLYGPQVNGNQTEFDINLSQIPVQVQIDKNWFSEIAITNNTIELTNLNAAVLENWEEKIWQRANLAPELKPKLTIKYSFLDAGAGRNNLNKNNLAIQLLAEQQKFNDSTHHGIIKLDDPNQAQTSGIVVKATFAKVTPADPSIQFIDASGTVIDDNDATKTTGNVNTQNIQTTLDLTNYINHLKNNLTNVTPDTAGAGTITLNGLIPPVLNGDPTKVLFANQQFKTIETWLKAAGLEFLWSVDGKTNWQTTANTRQYDPQKGQLFLALQNQASNLKVKLNATLNVNPNANSFAQPITINLNAPKVINVQPTDAQDLDVAFSGNTKYLTVDTARITSKIQKLLAQQGNQFNNAPLTLLVKVGNENFVDYQQLAATLSAKKTDVASGLITVRFAIRDGQNNAQQWQIVTGGENELPLITDQRIKIFINDQGIFNDLKTKTQLQGNNTSFQFNWANGWTVDRDGVLSAQGKGKGLRLEFSFANLDQASTQVGTNINNQWVKTPPTSYSLDKSQIYIRLQTQNNYVYERIESNDVTSLVNPKNQEYKFNLNLDLPLSIEIDRNWLNQTFSNKTIQLNAIKATDFDFYENEVKKQMAYSADIKAKIAIRYIFNGDNNSKLTREQLIAKLTEYQGQTNDETKNFGILQLWNGVAGIKISTTFVKADEADSSYNLIWKNNLNNPVDLNTEKIQTTINLSLVLNWLKGIKVDVIPKPNLANSIQSLTFPNISAAGDNHFNGKTWEQLKNVLANLGLKSQFRSLTQNNINQAENGWVNDQNALNTYDPAIGKIQIRFQFETNKTSNLKLQLDQATTIEGTQSRPTNAFDIQLKIKLLFQINSQYTSAFFQNPNAISGNTKNLVIDATAEKQMIDAIKAENARKNPEFAKANLYVGYQLGNGQNNAEWKDRAAFIKELELSQNDQQTNKVVYRFLVAQDQQNLFDTPADINVLHNHEQPARGIKIPYYINDGQWETNANNLVVNGTSSNLRWNFDAAFGANVVIERGNNVYLRNAAGEALQMFFTTNPAADYDNPTGFGTNLNQQWVSAKPRSLNVATTILKVKLVALNNGFVYGPANQNPKTARAHNVNLAIQREITVDKTWFTNQPLSSTEIELNTFIQNQALIQEWENQIYQQLARQNGIDQITAKKIQIKYILNGSQKKFSAVELLGELQQQTNDFTKPNLGIIQLWNGNKGVKIEAIFVNENSDFILKTATSNNPSEADLKAVVDSSKIYTSISLIDYIDYIKKNKTDVSPSIGGQAGQIDSFTLPKLPGAPGATFLSGYTFEEIISRLNEVGVQAKFALRASAPAADWKPKEQIKNYDIQTSVLFLAFEIDTNAANIRVQWDEAHSLTPGQNMQGANAIKLPLNVPKYIIINQNAAYFTNLAQKFAFRGDTKNLQFNQTNINNFVQAVLTDNVTNSGDNSYTNAPLEIHFQVGNLEFTKITDLTTYLTKQTVDLTDRSIRFKFVIPTSAAQNWKLVNPEQQYQVFQNNNDPELQKIKIYINDNGNFNMLQQMRLGGTQDNLDWPWRWIPKGDIDEASGILNPPAGGFGKGLQLQFSFRENPTSEGNDVETQWVGRVPKSFKSQYDKIWVQIKLTNSNLYTYENANRKFNLSLAHIARAIKVNTNWLNLKLNKGQNLDLISLVSQILINYEQAVLLNAQNDQTNPVDASLLTKFKIQYQFNDETTWVDQNVLISKINDYQNDVEQSSLGLLQLWNNTTGVKIKTKFVDADLNDNYEIQLVEQTKPDHLLDTSNIISTIDLSAVIAWLATIKIEVANKPGTPNSIQKLTFPNLDTPNNNHFNGKTWDKFKAAMISLGINLQFRSLTKNNVNNDTGWVDNESDLISYDPAIGKIQIRFKFNNDKAKNLKVKLDQNTTVAGTDSQPTKSFDVKLKIKLVFEINREFVNKFITNPNSIQGNTKKLVINAAAEQAMIDAIKKENAQKNPDFATAKLSVGYQLGDGRIGDQWLNRDAFIKELEDSQIDQKTNAVTFIFLIDPTQSNEFEVPNDLNPLHAYQAPAAGIKIPYYVNDATWETDAQGLILSGTSTNLSWNFTTVFGANTVVEKNNKVYLKNPAGEALQVYFTTNVQADYDTPTDLSDDSAQINQKWVSIKPNTLNAGVTTLKIKLVANHNGFIYGPAAANPKKAKAHNVDIQIKRELIVDKNWLTLAELSPQEIEINNLIQNNNLFNNWENAIFNEIAKKNGVSLDVAKNVQIKYFYGNENNVLDATGLRNYITGLKNDFGGANLGLVQLWNGTRGDKIKARFVSGNQDFIVRTETDANPNLADLEAFVKTNKIYTLISMADYINVLKTAKTEVELKQDGQPGEINSFTPPKMTGVVGDGLFSGQTYAKIAQRLTALGVQIKFAKSPSTQDADWFEQTAIKAYDPQLSALFLSLEIAANETNVKVQVNTTQTLEPGANLRGAQAIKLPLNVPKYIIVDRNAPYFTNINQKFAFEGNTKDLNFSTAAIQAFLTAILNTNATNSGDDSYRSAPLKILFQVGDRDFTEINQLKTYLQRQTTDLTDRTIRFKLNIPDNEANNWKLIAPQTIYDVLQNNDPLINKIKIYVNDNGNFAKLQAMVLEGTQDNLEWPWPWDKNTGINQNTGVLEPQVGGFGRGLKLWFSFNANATVEGPDVETNWVGQVPTTFKSQYNEIWLQVKLVDPQIYTYEHVDQPFKLSLAHIARAIKLNTDWLNLQFNNSQDLDLNQLIEQILTNYENAVKSRAQNDQANPVDASLLDKFKIEYQFNNAKTWVNKTDLIRQINDYQQNTTQSPFGILQLWNQQSGVPIKAKFSDADQADNYQIQLIDANKVDQLLNTSNVISTIDFTAVLDWLKNQEVPIDEAENYKIRALRIPTVTIAGNRFNNQPWSVVQATLVTFGLTIEYSNNLKGQPAKWGSITGVNEYDPTNPSFQIRFTTDGKKSTNIKFNWAQNQTLIGKTATQSQATILKIKAKLLVLVNDAFVNTFKTSAIFGGNTKNLEITNVQPAARNFLQQIITENVKNDSRYQKLQDQLEIQYVLQKQAPNQTTQWKSLEQLVADLKLINTDQITNQIWYRLNLKVVTDFTINAASAQAQILNSHEDPAVNIKIKYYVNAGTWESKANQIEVSGPTNKLEWNFGKIFSNSVVEEQGKVYLTNSVGQALQIYFILDNATADYDNPADLSDDASEIKTKWVSIKPTQIRVGTTSLKIKLVAKAGFVYGPAVETPKSATAHDVQISVKNVLYVDKAWLTENLVDQAREISTLNQGDFAKWEQKIYQQIKNLNQLQDEAVARKIKIKYTIGSNTTKFDAQGFLNEINRLRRAYNDQNTLGIVQLWNATSQKGFKIEAHFELDKNAQGDYLLQITGNANPRPEDLKNQINTDNVYTSVSLVEYIKVLKQEKTQVVPKLGGNPGEIDSFTPPQMKGNIGQNFLTGYSFAQISAHLKTIGIQVKFAKTALSPAAEWLNQEQVKAYDPQTSALFLSFEIEPNAKNIKIQWDDAQALLEPGQNMRGVNAIKLPLDVPKYIIINPAAQFWLQNKVRFNFRGNTKNIQFEQTAIDQFIKEILEENFTNSGGDSDYRTAPLKIEFQIGNLDFVDVLELKQHLLNQTDDLTNRNINFRFSIPATENNKWQLENPNETYALLDEKDSEIQKVKIYINDKNIFNDLMKTQLSGTSDQLEWRFINRISINPSDGVLNAPNRGKGLKVEFTFNENISENEAPGKDVNTQWVSQMPTSFGVNQTKILIRLALVDDNLYHYDKKYQKIELSLEDILLILKLQSNWLKLIQLSGNTKNLEINETRAQTELAKALPQNQPNLVQFKYSIDGNNWLDQKAFKALLIEKDAQKDAQNFILKREAIKVRFELEPTKIDKYQMVVDGNEIKPDNTNNPDVQLINDPEVLNSNVRGNIELKHLKYFVLDSFAIRGTNTQPQLIISKKTELETLMQNYATEQLFEILITSKQKNDGSWDFSQNINLLGPGNKFITDAQLIAKGFALGADKKVALKFKAKNPKYDVYKDGIKHDAGYDLDISQNVQITFEIENPFSKNGKTLALWWTDDRDKTRGKYYQGEGGFKIVNGSKNGDPDVANFMAANEWMQSAQSGLSSPEKEVLEFVYYIYDGEPSEQAINEAQNTITNYKDSEWKKVADVLELNGKNFTKNLELKVGQYLSVALRVKEQYASGNNIYTLKNNDYSFVKPIDGTKKLGRAHGYKVKTSAVSIDNDKIVLENFLNTEQAPLDGYTNIKNLSLIKDQNENYKGVDLKLQLFHQFYRQKNQPDSVIITPFDKIKLIKRQKDPNVTTNDYFKDANGQQIKDENNQPIPILLDAQGRPTRPEEATIATFNEKFINYDQGFFGMTIPQDSVKRNQWGIFKNQSVKVVFDAHQGVGGATDPDFILDTLKTVDLKDQISPKIKYPLFNQDNIKYEFNYQDFSKDKIEFENATQPENGPIDGRSKVKTLIKLIKTTSTTDQPVIIEGNTAADAVNKLKEELKTAFNDKIGFKTIYERKDGGIITENDLKLYNLNTLSNNDRIKIQIVATDDEFIWAEPPKQLTIHVNGLTAKAPNRDKLKFLRVEQSGTINGKGAFKVLINNPSDPNSNAKDLLDGWKFVLRVWDQEQQIKINWTDDQNQIANLKNGDKVEWKLLDEFNNPVSDPYYNTIAGQHKLKPDGSTDFVFTEVNYPHGKDSAAVVTEGIGKYPSDPDVYPDKSGFVISGLQDALEIFEISDAAFAKVMAQLEPHYVGLNGQGSINFKEDYLSKNYYVNSRGELYEKSLEQPTFKQQVDDTVVEISLADFLANTTFYTSDPNLINYQNGFKFLGNDTNLNNHLSNGDQVWAQFDLRNDNNEINRGISTELNPVTGLKDVVTDPMTPLWYILMAVAGIVSLGGLNLLVLWAKRHRKLKK